MRKLSLILTAMLATACSPSNVGSSGSETDTGNPGESGPSAAPASIYADAIANPSRLTEDRSRDSDRKPAEVMEFIGIEPGLTVLDMFAGGGYYTEIVASIVGETGNVIAQTNDAYLAFVGDEFARRFGNNRLANVEILMAENNELELAAESVDAIMLVLSFHDLYSVNAEQGWPKIDVPAFLAELHKGLRPGGRVGIIDHYAAAGSPAETGNTTHRIDPAIVIANMKDAGFVLEAQADFLRNPDDDYSKSVFEPTLRGRTDRFVMRFKKAD